MKIKWIVECIGVGVLLWDLVFVTRAFIWAYLSPTKTHTMNINTYGEATFEIILILVMLPFGLYVGASKLRDIYKSKGALDGKDRTTN